MEELEKAFTILENEKKMLVKVLESEMKSTKVEMHQSLRKTYSNIFKNLPQRIRVDFLIAKIIDTKIKVVYETKLKVLLSSGF